MMQATVKRPKGIMIVYILFMAVFLAVSVLSFANNAKMLPQDAIFTGGDLFPPSTTLGPLVGGSEVRQELLMQGELFEVSVLMATYTPQSAGTITFSLLDGEKELAAAAVPQAQIQDGAKFTLTLPSPYVMKRPTLLTLRILTEGSGDEDSVTVWCTETGTAYPQGNLYQDGILCDTDLSLSYRLAKRDLQTGWLHWVLTAAFLAAFSAAYWMFFGKRMYEYLKRLYASLKASPLRWLLGAGVLAGALCLGLATEYIYSGISGATTTSLGTRINTPRLLFFMAVWLLTAVFVLLGRQAKTKPEKLFAAVSLILGTVLILVTPFLSFSTWDEQIHYDWSLGQSFASEVYVTKADTALMQQVFPFTVNLAQAKDEADQWNELYGQGYVDYKQNAGADRFITRIGHFPAGLAMAFARALGLSFKWVILFGKMGILLAYTIIVYFAIRKLRSGKMLMSAIACAPTAFLLATNFSYDPWITAWLMLGAATYFSELQQPQKKLSVSSVILMLLSVLLASLPKQAYIPMLLPLLFFKRSKFAGKKQHVYYLLSVVLAGLLIAASFLIVRMGSLGDGDLRGGESVSISGQIQFILADPVGFFKMMFRFLKGYLSYASVGSAISFMAYLDVDASAAYALCLMLVIAVTDKSEHDLHTCTWPVRLWTWAGVLATVFAIAAVLYVSFTPVGLDTVEGCQARYLIPLLFPALYLIGSPKIENKMNRALYYYMGHGALALILLRSIWEKVVSHFF